MPERPYKVRKKISATMKGTSNFAGQEHRISSKAKISDKRGHYDPIRNKKWFVHSDTYKTYRKNQNPGGLFRRGRTVKENQMKSFIEYVVENKAMVNKMSDEHPEARFRTNPLKPTMSMKDRMAQRKNLSNLLKKKMNEGRLKDMVTGHMTTGKGMSFNKAVKAAQKDLDRMKPKQPKQQMKLPMKSEETINELSPETLGSYVQKASKDDQKVKISVKGRPSKLGPDYVRHGRTAEVFPQKRNIGMKRALTKLQKKMKTEEKMTPGQAAMKKLDSRPSNVALRNAIANVNRKAQDKINQRTKKAKADSKPR